MLPHRRSWPRGFLDTFLHDSIEFRLQNTCIVMFRCSPQMVSQMPSSICKLFNIVSGSSASAEMLPRSVDCVSGLLRKDTIEPCAWEGLMGLIGRFFNGRGSSAEILKVKTGTQESVSTLSIHTRQIHLPSTKVLFLLPVFQLKVTCWVSQWVERSIFFLPWGRAIYLHKMKR